MTVILTSVGTCCCSFYFSIDVHYLLDRTHSCCHCLCMLFSPLLHISTPAQIRKTWAWGWPVSNSVKKHHTIHLHGLLCIVRCLCINGHKTVRTLHSFPVGTKMSNMSEERRAQTTIPWSSQPNQRPSRAADAFNPFSYSIHGSNPTYPYWLPSL